MKIKHVNGTYWNENTDCFGPECAATEFETLDSCPSLIEDNNFRELEMYDDKYYTEYDEDAFASVTN